MASQRAWAFEVSYKKAITANLLTFYFSPAVRVTLIIQFCSFSESSIGETVRTERITATRASVKYLYHFIIVDTTS